MYSTSNYNTLSIKDLIKDLWPKQCFFFFFYIYHVMATQCLILDTVILIINKMCVLQFYTVIHWPSQSPKLLKMRWTMLCCGWLSFISERINIWFFQVVFKHLQYHGLMWFLKVSHRLLVQKYHCSLLNFLLKTWTETVSKMSSWLTDRVNSWGQ